MAETEFRTNDRCREREAQNQALFREVNERIEQLAETFGADGRNRLFCECGDPSCTQQIELTWAEYQRVREHAARFVVARDHGNPETQSTVEENNRFVVVETFADASPPVSHESSRERADGH